MSTSTTKTTFAPTRQDGWLSAREAAMLAGCSRKALAHMAARGLIGTKHLPLPNSRVWFAREDVLKLARASVTPARPDADAALTEQPT